MEEELEQAQKEIAEKEELAKANFLSTIASRSRVSQSSNFTLCFVFTISFTDKDINAWKSRARNAEKNSLENRLINVH